MFTLKDFNNLPCIYNPKVLTAKDKIENITIEHIAVIELPVDDFIRNNELVLTTAIGCHEDPELLLNLVKNVYLSKAAGLVLSIKDKNYEVPQKVINHAQSIGFPIIIIPWDCRFAEVVESVLSKIREYNKEKIQFFDNIQKELLSTYLTSRDLSSAAHIISEYLETPIVIVDVNYNIKGKSKNANTDSIEIISLVTDFEVLANIQIKDTLYGYLLTIPTKYHLVLEVADFENYLTMPLSLWFDKENVIDSTKLKLASDFVWNLALDKFDSSESMNTKAKLMGFDLQKPYTCILGEFAYLEDLSQHHMNHKYLQNIEMSNIVNQIRLLGRTSHRDIMITYEDSLIVIYIEDMQHDTVGSVHKFLDSIDNKIKSTYPFIKCFWGISEIKYKKTDFNKYYLNAKLALELSRRTYKGNTRSTYEDSNIFKILTILSKEDEVKEIVHSLLEDLIDYDKSKNSSLLITLRTFIQNNYNVSKTARELHLHRQSLLYRLDKIQELTNLSLENHENLFLLEICARLYSK